MGLEDFEPIFGQPKTEGVDPSSTRLLPFLLYVHALDSSKLRIHVTDFDSNTWVAVRSVSQLEDMRDNIGIGGPWSEFVDYIIASIKSEDVKLVFEGQSKEDGPAYAKLVAQKSKGLPRISISLDKLVGGAANEAMGNVSLELYRALKTNHELLAKEKEGRYQLMEMISAEQEKNQNLQRKLDSVCSSKRHKSQHMKEKAASDSISVSSLQDSPAAEKEVGHNLVLTNVANRVVPAYRRAKVRGVLLQDTEDDVDN